MTLSSHCGCRTDSAVPLSPRSQSSRSATVVQQCSLPGLSLSPDSQHLLCSNAACRGCWLTSHCLCMPLQSSIIGLILPPSPTLVFACPFCAFLYAAMQNRDGPAGQGGKHAGHGYCIGCGAVVSNAADPVWCHAAEAYGVVSPTAGEHSPHTGRQGVKPFFCSPTMIPMPSLQCSQIVRFPQDPGSELACQWEGSPQHLKSTHGQPSFQLAAIGAVRALHSHVVLAVCCPSCCLGDPCLACIHSHCPALYLQGLMLLCIGPVIDQGITQQWVLHYVWTKPALLQLVLSCGLAVLVNISQFMCLGRFSAVCFQVRGCFGHVGLLCRGPAEGPRLLGWRWC